MSDCKEECIFNTNNECWFACKEKIKAEEREKVLNDMIKGIKEILEDNAIYNIDCIDTLVNQLRK